MNESLSICGSCGAVRTRSAACPHCGVTTTDLKVSPRADLASWVCIECTFKCRMCGFRVPLNRLDMDGEVVCARCGLEQAFDVQQWSTVFEEAHAVADLWGERAKPFTYHLDAQYFDLGKVNASMVFNGRGENAVDVMASPGAPLCESCRAPLDVRLDEASRKSGRSSVACNCGENATYETPEAARNLAPLLATVCTEHRTDRKDVKVDATESAIAVRCPGCDAPLQASEGTKFITCTYCKTQARIPDRTWFKISKKEHVAERMWLLFQNPSKVRGDVTELQRLADLRKDERDQQSQREHEREVRSAQEAEQRQIEYAKKEKLRTAERAAEEEAREQRKRDKASSERTSTIVGFGVFAAFGIFLLVASVIEQKQKAEQAAEKPAPECDAEHAGVCLDTAAASASGGQYDDAVKDYETACNAGTSRACAAADALCTSLKASLDARLKHYEDYCAKNVFSECVWAGTMYATANGDGLGKDEPRAAGLFKKACDGANADGCQALAASCKRGVKEACPVHVDAGHKH